MSKSVEDKLLKIPVLNWLVKLGISIKIPGFLGMSLYDIIEMYIIGIVKGALTSRAGGIAFSFFMALFPFLLFILTLIPFVPIEGFQEDFLFLIKQLLPPNTADSVQMVIDDIDMISSQRANITFRYLHPVSIQDLLHRSQPRHPRFHIFVPFH